ncbi:MAG: ABC transporter ATP-binding protein [Planctomycetota bacterium]|nr:ABC transporter ATP-binding protein [Planctomycetota bacterium]
MPSVISLEDVSVEFATGYRKPVTQALKGLDLQVGRGEIVGVLGPNGAGKTTALRVIAGLQRPTKGRVRVLDRAANDRALRTRVGFQPTGPLPFPHLCGAEFLHYLGNLMQLPAATVRNNTSHWLERLQVDGVDKLAIRHYSTGMQRRLALAAALFTDPEVLLLDEPTSGLDPEGTLLVLEILQERAADGCAILMASHHLQEVEQTCDRVYLFCAGELTEHGKLDDLLGTGATRMVIRDLDESAMAAIRAQVEAAGGSVLSQATEREHLNAYYRRIAKQAGSEPASSPPDELP